MLLQGYIKKHCDETVNAAIFNISQVFSQVVTSDVGIHDRTLNS